MRYSNVTMPDYVQMDSTQRPARVGQIVRVKDGGITFTGIITQQITHHSFTVMSVLSGRMFTLLDVPWPMTSGPVCVY